MHQIGAVEVYLAGASRPPMQLNLCSGVSNIIAKWSSEKFLLDKSYDKDSIMHYAIPSDWTIGDLSIERAKQLSDGDSKWIGLLYPKNSLISNVEGSKAGRKTCT